MKLDGESWTAIYLVAIAAIVVLLVMLSLQSCSASVGWDPAMMRCRAFDGKQFTGPTLPNDRCAGLEKPAELPEG